MSTATVPRRKQAKPQRLATTSSNNDEDEVIPNKRLRNAPLSIEEQFQKQLSQSFEAHLLQKAKQAVVQFNSNSSENFNISPLELNAIDFLGTTDAVKPLPERDYEPDKAESTPNGIKGVNLLLPTSTSTNSPKGNFLLESLGTQQFLHFYNNALSQNTAQQSLDDEQPKDLHNHQRQDTNSATTSCLLSPPNSSFNDVASSTASSSSGERFGCPVTDCAQHFPNGVLQLLHLSAQHQTDRALHCASCDERFGDLHELRKHHCHVGRRAIRRCTSIDLGAPAKDEDDLKERAPSEPPNSECTWPKMRLTNEKQDNSAWLKAKEAMERPPLLLNEAAANKALLGSVMDLSSGGLKEMGLLAMRRQNANTSLSFRQPTFPASIPNFIPAHASSGTPPRGQRQFTPEEDWEAMMEISTIDETEKIRALVGDKALPVTDPNQCLLCRRVLSCKSALQMHYRTHTGERPFKCKICQRAFTTKGNLKTHMGVHRSKHSSLRGVGQSPGSSLGNSNSALNHQCPVCQKHFFSPQLLQQHVHEHTNQLANRQNELPPTSNFTQLFNSNGKKSPLMPQATPPVGFPHLPFLPPNFLQFGSMINPFLSTPAHFAQSFMQQQRHQSSEENGAFKMEESEHVNSRNGSDLLASLGFPPFKMPRLDSSGDEEGSKSREEKKDEEESISADRPSNTTTPQINQSVIAQERPNSGSKSLDLKPPVLAAHSPKVDNTSPTTSKQTFKSEENPLEAIQKMWAATEPSPPTRPPIQLSKHQCAVCFKHFSSSSALQIHTRTHTGDKPFKCEICSRAFTTRGNLKVHMSTHSYQTSPSRRGRRIFDFGTESLLRVAQQGINPFTNSSQPNTLTTAPLLGTPPFGFPAMNKNPAVMMSFPPFLAAMMSMNNKEGGEDGNQPGVEMAAQAQINAMFWLFKTVCSVCHKVCTSPTELQEHLKTHLENNDMTDTKENSS